jgi:ferredoxin
MLIKMEAYAGVKKDNKIDETKCTGCGLCMIIARGSHTEIDKKAGGERPFLRRVRACIGHCPEELYLEERRASP